MNHFAYMKGKLLILALFQLHTPLVRTGQGNALSNSVFIYSQPRRALMVSGLRIVVQTDLRVLTHCLLFYFRLFLY